MPAYAGRVFAFDHNWTDPVVERIAWLTGVLRKRGGSEQRFRLRQKPRRMFQYSALVGGEDELDQRRRLDALMWAAQDEEIMVPFWPDAMQLTDQIAAGATTTGVTAFNWKLHGFDIDNNESYLMFWKDYLTYEVVKISQINSVGPPTQLTFDTALVSTWPKGTVVVPARRCRHVPTLTGEIHATDTQSLKFAFELIVPDSVPGGGQIGYRAIAPTLDTYRSTDVYNDPGMNGENTRTLERAMTRIDFEVGQFSYDSIMHAPFGNYDMFVDLEGRTEISHFFGWLDARWGRQKAFWLPSWEKDFENVTRTGAATFTAKSFGYTAQYANAESRRDVALIKPDKTMLYRRITGSSDNGTTETFTVDSNLPDPLPSLDRASFLRYLRLDQDEIDLNWITTEDMTATLRVRELIKTA